MTIEKIKDTIQTWIRTADDEYDREEQGRVCGLKEALHLIEKLDVPDTNVGDYISRQAVLEWIKESLKQYASTYSYDMLNMWMLFEEQITGMPPVTPQQKTGRWIYTGDYITEGMLRCSICDFEHDVSERFLYCPYCGAKMEVEE